MSKIDDGGFAYDPVYPSEQGMTPDGQWNQSITRRNQLADQIFCALVSGWKEEFTFEQMIAQSYELADKQIEEGHK